MTSSLTYRLYRDGDLPSLRRLWKEETGWGELTPEVWHQWYVHTPHGPCLIVVSEDESGEIAGQMVFMPQRVVADGKEVRALRISAPILRRDARRTSARSRTHPIIGLYDVAAEVAAEQGYSVIYSLPDHAWLPFFRWESRFADAEYGCVESSVNSVKDSALADADNLKADLVTEFSNEYDALWESAKDSFPVTCGVVRHRDWVRFRNSGRITIEVRDERDNSLVGYTATKKQTGLLADILVRNPSDLVAVLAATLKWFTAEKAGAAHGITRLKAMETPALRPALQSLNFAPVDYKFAFACNSLDPSLTPEAISPERWYVTPGD